MNHLDEMTGTGVRIDPNGNRYSGEFLKGKPHGQGVMTWTEDTDDAEAGAGGNRYEGEWRHGVQEGQGVRTWPDGSKYEGQFSEGELHGQGVHTTLDYTYEGAFFMGKMHGHGMVVDTDGRKYEGKFEDGQPVGEGHTFLFPGGPGQGSRRREKAPDRLVPQFHTDRVTMPHEPGTIVHGEV